MNIEELQKRAHETAVAKGWHESTLRDERGNPTVTQFVAWMGLAHSEAAEADNETAHHYIVDGKPEGKIVELADVVIRLLDAAGACSFEPVGVGGMSLPVHSALAAITEQTRKSGIGYDTSVRLYSAVQDVKIEARRFGYDWRMFEAIILEKMDYNETRPHRHGGKLA